MYPQDCFDYHKRPFWPVLCLKRIGLPCCTFVTIIVTCSLQTNLLSNYSLLTVSALADITLLKTTCHFLLLLVGFDTLTYRKELQLIPYTCGSLESVRLRRLSRPWCTNGWADGMGVGNHGLGTRLSEMWGKLRKYPH